MHPTRYGTACHANSVVLHCHGDAPPTMRTTFCVGKLLLLTLATSARFAHNHFLMQDSCYTYLACRPVCIAPAGPQPTRCTSRQATLQRAFARGATQNFAVGNQAQGDDFLLFYPWISACRFIASNATAAPTSLPSVSCEKNSYATFAESPDKKKDRFIPITSTLP